MEQLEVELFPSTDGDRLPRELCIIEQTSFRTRIAV